MKVERIRCKRCGATAFATEAICPSCGQLFGDQPEEEEKPSFDLHPTFVGEMPIEDLAAVLAANLQPGERILASVENEHGSVSLVATTRRILVLRAGEVTGAFHGAQCKEYPYLSIEDIICSPGPLNAKIQIKYRGYAGKPEVGRRARLAQQLTDNLMPFPKDVALRVTARLEELLEKAREEAARQEQET